MKKVFVGIAIAAFVTAMLVMVWIRTRPKETASPLEKTSTPVASSSATESNSTEDTPEESPRTRVAGRVLDGAGAGVENAAVCAWFEQQTSSRTELLAPSCVMSASDGAYELVGLRAGPQFKLSATATNHAPATYISKSGSPYLRLTADEQKNDIDIVLSPGGVAVRGRVRDALGGVVGGATIVVTFNEDKSAVASISDDKGEFIAWVMPGMATVKASATGYADAFASGEAPQHRFEISMLPSSSIIGRAIMRPGGAAVAGANVEAVSIDQGARKTARADGEGVFRIDGLPPGRYRLEGLAPGLSGYSPGSVLVGLADTSHDAVVELVRSPPVTAKVLDSLSHTPCKGGGVTLQDSRQGEFALGTIQPDGMVQFQGVLPGKYSVEVACDDHIRKTKFPNVTVADRPVTGLTWEVDRGSEVRGVVVDADGNAVANATVQASSQEGDVIAPTQADGKGAFVLRGFSSGHYSLAGTSALAGAQASTEVDVDGQHDMNGIRVELGRAAKMTATLVDVDGKPVGNIGVILAGPTRANETTRDDGTFVAHGLEAGNYRLFAMSESTRLRFTSSTNEDLGESVSFKIATGEKLTKTFVVERRTGILEGRVVDVRGEALPDFFVDAQRIGGQGKRRSYSQSQSRVLTDSSGRFRITGLADGEYTVRAYRQSGAMGVVEHVNVGKTDVAIEIAAGGIAINVVNAQGAHPERFTVNVMGGKRGASRSDLAFHTDGAFTVTDLPPGNYDIVIDSPEGNGRGTATVTDGALASVTVTLKPPPEPELEGE